MGDADEPPRDQQAEWETLVVLVAQLDGVPDALAKEHRADNHGRCLGCRLPQSGDQVWPCTLFAFGIAAIEVRAGRFRFRAVRRPPAAWDAREMQAQEASPAASA